MGFVRTRISRRGALVTALWLFYLPVAGGYLLLVSHKSGVWQTKRQQLINESPTVWVAPHGNHYHLEKHYSRHLSSPITLYEATERDYFYCNFCHPPLPTQLLHCPIWLKHWVVIIVAATCSSLILTLLALYKVTPDD